MNKQQFLSFLEAYLLWTENTNVNPHDFVTNGGLCFNAQYFYGSCFLRKRIQNDFPDNYDYPFNDCGSEGYHTEYRKRECHLNPKRIAWVKKTIEELKTEINQEKV